MLLQEAMRLSLIEHEAEQKRQQQEKAKQAANGNTPEGNEAGPSAAGPSSSGAPLEVPAREDTATPASGISTGSVSPSPQPRSHLPISPSPLANASAAIALGIGMPGTSEPRGASPARLAPQDDGSSSRSHSRKSSRSHSRNASQSNLPFNTLAAALGAANVASAYVGGSATPPPSQGLIPTERSAQGSSNATPLSPPPPLPVLVSPSELFEDTIHAQPAVGNAPGSSSSDLPTVVPGVPATSADIPSPGPASQRSAGASSEVPTPSPATPMPTVSVTSPTADVLHPSETESKLPGHSSPSIISQSLSLDGEADDTSSEGEVEGLDYKILPSTPSLAIADPLIPEMSRMANGSSNA